MDSLPDRKRGESKLAVQRARDLLMAEKAAMMMASDSAYKNMLQMSPDELREAYEKLNATERKEFERYYNSVHRLQQGRKIVKSFRKRGEGELSEWQKRVKAMQEGHGYTESWSRRAYEKKKMQKAKQKRNTKKTGKAASKRNVSSRD